jgi:hypothetical protein
MIVLAVVLGVVAVVGVVVALVARSRLAAQRRLTAAAETHSTEQAAELARIAAALEAAAQERAVADERAAAAAARADEAEAGRQTARGEAEQAAAAAMVAEQRAAAAEQRAAEFTAARAAAADGGGIDARLLWTLEQARSERTWRHSVALGPDSVSVFSDASDPLYEALQVELDAAREEVGAVVELEADLPAGVTPAGSVLALRAAQELLANVVRRGEVTTLHVHAEGDDLVVAVRSVDEEGEPVPTEPLDIPRSPDLEQVADGVRILGAVRRPDDAAGEATDDPTAEGSADDQAEIDTSVEDDTGSAVTGDTAGD